MAQGVPPLVPVQSPAAGTPLRSTDVKLFQPLQIRGEHFQNRIWVSPMCQYSCACQATVTDTPGRLTTHHYAHYAALISRGPSLTIIEATAVTPNGRISPYDSGLWNDEQIAPLAAIVAFAEERSQFVGIQLAHAGRKASTKPPWQLHRGLASQVAEAEAGGWPQDVVGPGIEPWDTGYAQPRKMSKDDIQEVVRTFSSAARRAMKAGIKVIEVHAAHGYLLGSFLSRVTNRRTDEYGGSLTNRMRFLLEVVQAVRQVVPSTMPLLVRISASEWLQNDDRAWNEDESVRLAVELYQAGVDMLTISSGGNTSEQRIPRTLDYQTNLARAIRRRLRAANCPVLIGAVGRIAEAQQAEKVLTDAAGDVVLVGRQFLKEPSWVLRVAQELGVAVKWPVQYQLGRYGLETKL